MTLENIYEKEVSLGKPDSMPSSNKKLSRIIVVDARNDSSSLGYYKSEISRRPYRIVDRSGIANDVSMFIKNYLNIGTADTKEGITILLVIKKLWLTNALKEAGEKNTGQWQSGVRVKFEFYAGNDSSFSPLYRFDTSCAITEDIGMRAKTILRNVLQLSVQKLSAFSPDDISQIKKKMAFSEIEAYNKSQFTEPVLNVASYNKGLYKTFNEFRLNSPSISDYELKQEKDIKTIFIKEKDVQYPARDVWGYCNGTDIYIKRIDNYYKLVKKQNTFISNACKSVHKTTSFNAANILMLGFVAGTVGPQNKKISYVHILQPYELDMDNGILY